MWGVGSGRSYHSGRSFSPVMFKGCSRFFGSRSSPRGGDIIPSLSLSALSLWSLSFGRSLWFLTSSAFALKILCVCRYTFFLTLPPLRSHLLHNPQAFPLPSLSPFVAADIALRNTSFRLCAQSRTRIRFTIHTFRFTPDTVFVPRFCEYSPPDPSL